MSDTPSEAYWAGAAEGRLVVQRCSGCGTLRHYPRVLCHVCWSFEAEPADGGASGRIESWTVAHHAFAPDLPAELPYTIATVTMTTGVRVLGILRLDGPPQVGQGVTLTFEATGPEGRDRPIPVFAPTSDL